MDLPRQGFALGRGRGVGPKVGKVAALLGFHRLDGANIPLEEDAFAARLFVEDQAPAIGVQSGVKGHKFLLGQAQMRRDAGDIAVGDADAAWPPATGAATLAFQESGHQPFPALPAFRSLRRRRISPRFLNPLAR